MIYGKMWTVVRPTVGIPLIIGAVAVGSFSVHYAILSHTTWVSAFLEGGAAKTAAASAAAVAAPAAPVKK
jgi:light-harvesting protein B-800-850 alpha chain